MKPHRFPLARLSLLALIAAGPLAAPAGAQEGVEKAPTRTDPAPPAAPAEQDTTPGETPADTAAEESGTWLVQGPNGGRWTLRSGRDYEVVVTAGDEALRGLELVGSTLQNEESGARLGVSMLQLCGVDGGMGARDTSTARATGAPAPRDTGGRAGRDAASCKTVDSIPAGKSATLRLRIDRDSTVRAGEYNGAVSFAADGGEGLKQLTLKVENTSYFRWLLGALLIAVGVFLSWLMTVAFRQANTHFAARLAVERLRSTLANLKTRAEEAGRITGTALPQILGQIAALEKDLSDEQLAANGLPPRFANPFRAAQDGVFEAYRTEKETQIQALAVIVRKGVAAALAAWPGAQDKAPITAALGSLDAAAKTQLEPAAAEKEVDRILEEMKNALAGSPPSLQAMRTAGADRPTARELQVRLVRISLAGWGVSLVLTVLVGMVVLVITDYGFGTALDYVKCLFWGMGLPFVTREIQQLGSTSVQSTLKLTLPPSPS